MHDHKIPCNENHEQGKMKRQHRGSMLKPEPPVLAEKPEPRMCTRVPPAVLPTL
jgi:hypothetical protein